MINIISRPLRHISSAYFYATNERERHPTAVNAAAASLITGASDIGHIFKVTLSCAGLMHRRN